MPDSPQNVPIIEIAKECFVKNRLNYPEDSEQENLYNGLFHLAIAIQQIQEEIAEMKAKRTVR